MLYMVIERFREGMAPLIYRRAQEKGRMTPDGLEYVSSWMRTNNESLFDAWTDAWEDLVEFEIVPVRSSCEAAHLMGTTI